jgi:Tol biopolymer transport system component
MYDLSGASALRQLTFGGRNRSPVWSPDGRYVAFQSDREGDSAIFRQLADGTGTAERLTKPDSKVSHIPDSWSPDGKTILYEEFKDSRNALWTLSVPERKVGRVPDIESPGLLNAIFSHDGRWIAYNTNPDASVGQTAVFVQPFPATGAKSWIGRGFYPLWSLDGHELSYFFRQQLQTVSIGTQAGVTFGNPAPLSTTATFLYSPSTPRIYDITPDGKQVIAVTPAEGIQAGTGSATQIQVVLNWQEELKQRVPTK